MIPEKVDIGSGNRARSLLLPSTFRVRERQDVGANAD